MKVDVDQSVFHEDPEAKTMFDAQGIRKCRLLLRRLRFLEQKIRETGGTANSHANGGAHFTEWEAEALEWILGEDGVNFLSSDRTTRPHTD